APATSATPGWRAVWQLPTLIAARLLLVARVAAAFLPAPRPSVERRLAAADGLIDHEDYKGALGLLNDKVRSAYDAGSLTPDQGRRFHLLRGRAVYLGEKQAGVENDQNAKNIIDEYAQAMKDGGAIPPR